MLFCKRYSRSKNLSQAFSFILACLRNRKIGFHQKKEKKKPVTPELEELWVCGPPGAGCGGCGEPAGSCGAALKAEAKD